MKITVDMLRRISLSAKPNAALMGDIVSVVNEYGAMAGLDQPHRLAHYLPNLAVESGHFTTQIENLRYTSADRIYAVFKGSKSNPRFKSVAECKPYVNNPEKLANKVYGGRMGNKRPGDGWKYRGRGPKQITGFENYKALTVWMRSHFPDCPDFVEDPDELLKAPWNVLSTLWFWMANNCNKYADRNDPENLRNAINGGLNGYEQILPYYDRSALVLLGYGVSDLVKFQKANRISYTTGSGPVTRATLHKALLKKTDMVEQSDDVAIAPVTETKEVEVKVDNPVPVKIAELEKPWYKNPSVLGPIVGTAGVGGTLSVVGETGTKVVQGIGGIPWQNLAIIVGAVVVMALFMIWRRDQNKKKQAQEVKEIKAEG